MNRAAEILDYLGKTADSELLLIAPMAPPVDRTASGLRVAINRILDASDVADTLASIRSRAVSDETSPSGSFSFGIKDIGRFRVNYVTQRGSRVFSISRVPVRLPDIDSLSEQAGVIRDLLALVEDGTPGAILVTGPNLMKNGLLVYSALRRVNQNHRRVICCVERALSALMGHDNSIVVQSEVGIDCPTMTEGIRQVIQFHPDILFVGDVRHPDDMEAVAESIEAGALAILSATFVTGGRILDEFHAGPLGVIRMVAQRLKGVLHVTPASNGMLHLRLEIPHAAARPA